MAAWYFYLCIQLMSGDNIYVAYIILQIKAMKEMYLPEINEMHQKIATKLQQVF
jgi:hypothetical protein